LNSDTWTHHKTDLAWTVNNGTYGGIAANEDYAFMTDMGPDYNNPEGVVRFDLDNGGFTEVDAGIGSIDLNLGLDGKLYVLYPGGSPGGRFIKVFDPDSLSFIDEISLAAIFGHTAHRAIAANKLGEIFIADWDGDIQKIDSEGNVLAAINICSIGSSCSQFDIDVDEDGTVITTNRASEVFVMDSNLENIRFFPGSSSFGGGFASFVGYSLIPVKISLFNSLNATDCVEALAPDGTLLSFEMINSNTEPVQYAWGSTSGETGNGPQFDLQVAVNETTSVTATILEPVSGRTQSTTMDVCVNDTIPPAISILSPIEDDVIKNGKIDMDISITDAVDPDISSYKVFVGRVLELSYPDDSRSFDINLKSGSKDIEPVNITVQTEDYSGNRAEESVQITLKDK
jgi:hypothetical protein